MTLFLEVKMGQYFLILNLDKKEYLHPHKLGSGLKLWEICANNVCRVLPFLLRKSNETGGGDIREDYPTAGRWAGDRIVVVGDYDESGLYDLAKRFWKDISEEVKEDFNDFIELEDLKVYSNFEDRLAARLGKPDRR